MCAFINRLAFFFSLCRLSTTKRRTLSSLISLFPSTGCRGQVEINLLNWLDTHYRIVFSLNTEDKGEWLLTEKDFSESCNKSRQKWLQWKHECSSSERSSNNNKSAMNWLNQGSDIINAFNAFLVLTSQCWIAKTKGTRACSAFLIRTAVPYHPSTPISNSFTIKSQLNCTLISLLPFRQFWVLKEGDKRKLIALPNVFSLCW